jgi:hypothetical protein
MLNGRASTAASVDQLPAAVIFLAGVCLEQEGTHMSSEYPRTTRQEAVDPEIKEMVDDLHKTIDRFVTAVTELMIGRRSSADPAVHR